MKILASDFDGTLRTGCVVNKSDIEAIKRFRAAGNKFGLITGRAPKLIEPDFKLNPELECDFNVLASGAIILDAKGKPLFESHIPTELAKTLLERLRHYNALHYGISDAQQSCVVKTGWKMKIVWRGLRRLIAKPDGILSRGQVLCMVCQQKTEAETAELGKRLEAEFGDSIRLHYNKGSIDITAPNATKAEGAAQLERIFGQPIYRIGDALNDVEMLKCRGFCVANGCDEAKAAAGRVVGSVGEAIDILMSE